MVHTSKASKASKAAYAAALLIAAAACGGGARAPGSSGAAAVAPSDAVLRDDAGRPLPLGERVAGSSLTVLVFFSGECPVQKAHDARLREIIRAYSARGVTFAAVVSEAGADLAAERSEAHRRGLDMPVLEDCGAALADALGVEYSTHTVVLDCSRRVLYTGGLDSDRTHLSPGAERWLERALDGALSGGTIARAKTEPLGCPLRKH